jgi:hypothetical protein
MFIFHFIATLKPSCEQFAAKYPALGIHGFSVGAVDAFTACTIWTGGIILLVFPCSSLFRNIRIFLDISSLICYTAHRTEHGCIQRQFEPATLQPCFGSFFVCV